MAEHAEFAEIGKRMLLAWHDGIDSLRCKRIYPMRSIDLGAPFTPFPDPKTVKAARKMVGRSGLVGRKQ
jgi:serine/threonine-protein kinase HipA